MVTSFLNILIHITRYMSFYLVCILTAVSIMLLLQFFVVSVHERLHEVFQAEPLVLHFSGTEAPRVEIELVG